MDAFQDIFPGMREKKGFTCDSQQKQICNLTRQPRECDVKQRGFTGKADG